MKKALWGREDQASKSGEAKSALSGVRVPIVPEYRQREYFCKQQREIGNLWNLAQPVSVETHRTVAVASPAAGLSSFQIPAVFSTDSRSRPVNRPIDVEGVAFDGLRMAPFVTKDEPSCEVVNQASSVEIATGS